MRSRSTMTDDQLLAVDVAILITGGVAERSRPLFAEGAVAAAVRADAVGTLPRSLTFLAEVVRRGGLPYAAELSHPLPSSEQAQLARDWIAAALRAGRPTAGAATTFARWLDAVAAVVDSRRSVRAM
jgi:hypothetical protein